jgi:hypothetical protein
MSDKTFANGIIFAYPNGKAPEFVIGKISVKKSEFIPFLESQDGDWVNLDVKLSKTDKIYCELNSWKPKKEVKNEIPDVAPSTSDDLPF